MKGKFKLISREVNFKICDITSTSIPIIMKKIESCSNVNLVLDMVEILVYASSLCFTTKYLSHNIDLIDVLLVFESK